MINLKQQLQNDTYFNEIEIAHIEWHVKTWLNKHQWIKLNGNPETRYISLDELLGEITQ